MITSSSKSISAARVAIVLLATWAVLSLLAPIPMGMSPLRLLVQAHAESFGASAWTGFGSTALRVLISLLSIAGAGLCWDGRTGKIDLRRVFWMSAGAVVALEAVSATAGELPEILVTWLPFWACTIMGLDERNKLLRLVYILLCAQMIVGASALLLGFQQFSTPGLGRRASGLMGSPNGFYPLCIAAFFCSAFLYRKAASSLSRSFFITMALLSSTLLFLTYSRSAWVGFAVVLLAYTVLFQRASLYLATVLLVVGSSLFFVQRRPSFQDASIRGRNESIRYGLDVVKEHPWAGGGLNAFPESIGYRRLLERTPLAPSEPKSQALHILTQFGLLGFVVHLLFFGSAFALMHRGARRLGARAPTQAAYMILPALAVSGIYDVPILANPLQVPASMTVLILLADAVHVPKRP